MDEEEKTGKKFDDGKPMWSLLPFREVEDVVQILTFGAKKYAPGNWKKVPDAHDRYLSALLRHITAYAEGDKTDKESGLSRLAHAVCNCLFLMWFDRNKKD